MGQSAIILGATGLVGRELLHLLLYSDEFSQIVSLARRGLPDSHPKLQQELADFDNLSEYASHFAADVIFICLGSTIARAKSNAAFRKVDYDYVIEASRMAAEQGAGHLLVVSALGANPRSSIFYNQVKGDMELAVSLQPVPRISIFRPSLLSGARTESRRGERLGLWFAKLVSPLLKGKLLKYRHIPGAVVAGAMLHMAVTRDDTGVRIFQSDEIARIGS